MSEHRKQTFSSPYLHAINPETMGSDSYCQHAMVLEAVKKYFADPFESSQDLRGASFRIRVHENGLHVSIEGD